MHKKILLLSLMIVLFSALASASLTTNATYYYSLDANESQGAYTNINYFNKVSSTYTAQAIFARNVSGFINQASRFNKTEASTGRIEISNSTYNSVFGQGAIWSFNAWVRVQTNGTAVQTIMANSNGGNSRVVLMVKNGRISFVTFDGTSFRYSNTTNINREEWVMVTVAHSPTTFKLYVNGVLAEGTATAQFNAGSSSFSLGNANDAGWTTNLDGNIDEVFFLNNRRLQYDEIQTLYNGGLGLQYPFTSPPSVANHTISFVDIYDNSPLTNVSIDISGKGTYSNLTGNIVYLDFSDGNLYDITVSADNYFSDSYNNINLSINTSYKLRNSQVSFVANEILTNNTVSANITIGSTTNAPYYNLKAGTYTVIVTKAGYYNKNYSVTISALQNNTVYLQELYSTIINLSAYNAFSLIPLNNISGFVYHNDTGVNTSFSNSTGSQYQYKGLINNNYYSFLYANDYAISDETNYNQFIANSSFYDAKFYLYTKNSVYISIIDQDTDSLILENISVIVSGNLEEVDYYTITGHLFIENLTDGEYTIKFSGANYSLVSYALTVSTNSFQYLTAYLSADTETVIFNIKDFDNAIDLEGATVLMARLINNSWATVSVKNSDISGRVQLVYKPNIRYRFTVSNDGYNTNIFYLDPILFDTYNVLLTKTTIIDNPPAYISVFIDFSTLKFYANQTNNLTMLINSFGALQNYNFTIVSLNGTAFYTGNNANGESFNYLFYLPLTNNQNVSISYCYLLTVGSEKCFSYSYNVIGSYNPYSFEALRDNTFGLGLFERILFGSLFAILLGGFISAVAGILAGAGLTLLILGFFTFTGFIPLWAVLPSILVGFVLIMARSD